MACTYFADTFTTAKRTDGTLYEILGNAQLSFRCCVGLAQLKETPAHRTATWLRLRSYLRRCTTEPSPHLPPAMFAEVTSATLRAHLKQGLSTARWQERGVACPYTRPPHCRPAEADQEISAAPACPSGICHGEVRPLSQKQLLPRLGLQPYPKCWQQWPTDQLTPRRKCLRPPTWCGQTTTMTTPSPVMIIKLKMKIWRQTARNRAGRRGWARVNAALTLITRALSIGNPHSIFQTKSTFICGINGVRGGGGGCNFFLFLQKLHFQFPFLSFSFPFLLSLPLPFPFPLPSTFRLH